MTVMEIRKYGDPVLKKKCEEVLEVTEEVKRFCRDLVETMKENKGLGLAASQVGVLKRIIAVQTGQGPIIFINPKIYEKSKEVVVMEEGCLSFPKIYLKIKRPKSVKAEALDGSGKKIEISAEGLMARVIQHEVDHLDGILIADKVGLLKKLKIKKQKVH